MRRRFSLAKLLGHLRAPRRGHRRKDRTAPLLAAVTPAPLLEQLEARQLLSGRGLAGYYFTSPEFTELATRREDPQIVFNFDSKSNPASGSDDDGAFGARWSARVMPKFSELYRFYTRSTGGVRVWVDGQLIIDDWTTHALKDNKGTISLLAGERYDLRIEYFDAQAASTFELHWASKRQAREVVPQNRLFASHFDTTAPSEPTKLRATYVTDTAFKFIWNPSTDDSGTVVYETYLGRTRLGATTDTYYTRGGRMPESDNSVHVRAVDFAGNVTMSEYLLITTTEPPPPGNGTGLAGLYYAGPDFSQYKLTRTDPQINKIWNAPPFDTETTGRGDTDVEFSARWEGKLLPQYTEWYNFSLASDGAARLWMNDLLVVDRPENASSNETTGGLKLRAGRLYTIRVEYQHVQTPSETPHIIGTWSSLSTKKEIIPAVQFYPKFVDSAAPVAPGNLRVDSAGQTSVSLRWDAAADDVGVIQYNLFRNGKFAGSTTGLQYTDTNLTPGTSYDYHVVAVDGAAHASPASNSVRATTQEDAARDAMTTIAAGDYHQGSGVNRAGSSITDLDDGNWVQYRRLDFGSSGARSLELKLGASVSGAGGVIEVRLDSLSGPVIARHTVQPTGSYGTRYAQRVSVSGGATGVHDVYFVFKNKSEVAELESFRFSTQRLVRILPLGDSITDAQPGYNSYRYYLHRKLRDAGFGVDFVGSQISNNGSPPPNFDFDQNHEGHSGIHINQVLENITTWMNNANPDIVLIHLGTNDLWGSDTVSNAIDETGRLIDAIRAVKPSIKIVLAQLIPLEWFTDRIAAFNSELVQLAASKNNDQSPIALVDQYTGFDVHADTYDGVHPNNGGASKMADRWYNAVAAMLG